MSSRPSSTLGGVVGCTDGFDQIGIVERGEALKYGAANACGVFNYCAVWIGGYELESKAENVAVARGSWTYLCIGAGDRPRYAARSTVTPDPFANLRLV